MEKGFCFLVVFIHTNKTPFQTNQLAGGGGEICYNKKNLYKKVISMQQNSLKMLTCIAPLLFLVACSSADDTNTTNEQNTPAPVSTAYEAFQPKTAEDFLDGDPRYPSVNIDSKLQYLRYLYMAKFPDKLTDEQKVAEMVEGYYDEGNAFTKKEIFDREIAIINQEIAKYQGDYAFKVPLIIADRDVSYNISADFTQKQTELNLTSYMLSYINALYMELEAYDFKKQGFPRMSCEFSANDIGEFKLDEPSVKIGKFNVVDTKAVFEPNEDCVFVVTDENLAREIEEIRNNNPELLMTIGTVYYSVTAKDDKLFINPTHADLALIHIENPENILSTLHLTWDKLK